MKTEQSHLAGQASKGSGLRLIGADYKIIVCYLSINVTVSEPIQLDMDPVLQLKWSMTYSVQFILLSEYFKVTAVNFSHNIFL